MALSSLFRDVLLKILVLRGIHPKLVKLISGLHSRTEKAVRCDGTISDYFPVNTGVRQGCALTNFNTCMDHVLVRMSEKSGCRVPFGTVRITDLDSVDDAVIFAETPEILREALESLSEEAEPLGLQVSWMKTKIQAFGEILDVTIESIPVSGKNVVKLKLTHFCSVIHSSTSCELQVSPRLAQAWSTLNLLNEGLWRCRYLCERSKVRVFRSVVLSVLLYSCETWTLTGELRWRLISFGTMSLRRILCYRWHGYMSIDRVLREAGLKQVTCIDRERYLPRYRRAARLPAEDPAHQIFSC